MSTDQAESLSLRDVVEPEDEERVRTIVLSTGFFTPEEVEIAAELAREACTHGEASGYRFLFASCEGSCVAYTCCGRIPGTESSYDLYWIAVHADWRGRGLGKRLLDSTERRIHDLGGTHVWVETSSRALYAPTREFYVRCAYRRVAELDDFYRIGDGKVIYSKILSAGATRLDHSR